MKSMMTRILILVMLLVVAGPLSPDSAPVHAQSGVTWSVEYYNNIYLSGSPVLTQSQTGLEFYWGGGSPSQSVPADYFSARFATDTYFAAGSYRFYILADDAIRLWVDYPPNQQPHLDTMNAPKPGQLLTYDTTLDAGSHHIQVDFRENTGDAYLFIGWENLNDGAQGPSFNAPPTAVTWATQWTAQYFNNTWLGYDPVYTTSMVQPQADWGGGSPGSGVLADNFSARWSIYQDFAGGTYTASVNADDGVRVTVDSTRVIDEWHGATTETYEATFPLSAGPHSIVIEYYEATGAAHLTFRMVKQSGSQPPSTTGATARVTAWRLNVRNAPVSGDVIAKVSLNEVYPVVGRNSDSSWWQINVNGTVGWVSGRYVVISGGNVPVTDGTASQQPTPYPPYVYGQCPGFLPSRLAPGSTGRVTPGLAQNVRAGAGYNNAIVGQIPAGGIFYVMSGPVCASNTAWYQVIYQNVQGWTAEGQSSTYWLEPYTQ